MDIEKSRYLQRDISDFKRERKPLGKGQFGCVYPCTDKKNGKKYAIKLIEPTRDVSTEDMSYKLFTREVTIQSQIKHHAMLPLYCWGENCFVEEYGEISFIMSPLMSNGSLDMYINDKRIKELDPTKKMIIIYGSAVGMKHLHSKGVMHRDLKPGNILIDDLYYPYIGDFGFSKFTPKNNDTTFSIRPGTPLYTAPELLEDEEELLSNKVDVYAFGIIIYNVLTGKQFSEIKNTFKLQQYVVKGNRPTIPKEINDFYKDLITRCWSQSPNDRPSFEEIVSQLEKPENLLPGADKKRFDKYKKYVNEKIPSDDDDYEDEIEDDVDKEAKTGSDSLPPPQFSLSFRGYPQISLSKSHNFQKFILFHFDFNGEEDISINLGKNITIGDAKIVIAIEQKIPPSYLEISFNGKKLNETGKLSLIKCSETNPIHINLVKDLSELPSDDLEREVEVENEIHELVNFKTTKRILKTGKPALMDSLDIFHNFFLCGKSISLFNSCIDTYEKRK